MAGQPNELYGSHLPLLTRIMDLSSGSVLELGMGLYSTPLLHVMCALQNRELISFDSDQKWYKENLKWTSVMHTVAPLVTDWDFALRMADEIYSHYWGVVFIDEKPGSHRRKSLEFFAHKADYVIIHDSEPEADRWTGYSKKYGLYKYRFDYTKFRPFTTVLSNFIDVSKLLL